MCLPCAQQEAAEAGGEGGGTAAGAGAGAEEQCACDASLELSIELEEASRGMYKSPRPSGMAAELPPIPESSMSRDDGGDRSATPPR